MWGRDSFRMAVWAEVSNGESQEKTDGVISAIEICHAMISAVIFEDLPKAEYFPGKETIIRGEND